jgi:hypothetical protein
MDPALPLVRSRFQIKKKRYLSPPGDVSVVEGVVIVMVWSSIRLLLFTAAFSIGMWLAHSGNKPDPTPVLNESAGASLVVACDEGPVVVGPLRAGNNAIQLYCAQSKMVVVRDNRSPRRNVNNFNRIQPHFQ